MGRDVYYLGLYLEVLSFEFGKIFIVEFLFLVLDYWKDQYIMLFEIYMIIYWSFVEGQGVQQFF